MKKVLFTLCAISVVFLFGCGKDNSVKQGTPENPYTIIWYNDGAPPKDLKEVMKKVNEYLIKKIGCKLDMKYVDWGNYGKKVNMISAAGESYDLCFTATWGYDYRTAVQKGYLLQINDLVKKYGAGIEKAIGEESLKNTMIDGKLYAVPVKKEEAEQVVYVFNKKYLEKYNFDVSKVKSLKDLEPMLEIIKKKEPEIIPLYAFKGWTFPVGFFEPVMKTNVPGAIIIDAGNHKVVNQYIQPKMMELFRTMYSFFKKGYIMASAATTTEDSSYLKTGRWFVCTQLYQPYAENIYENNWGFPVICIPSYEPPVKTVLTGAMIGISSTAERPDLDMKFLNLLNTDKYLRNLIGYGIEGIHYKKIGENQIKLLPESKNYTPAQFTLGNIFLNYVTSKDPLDKWHKFDEWNKSAVTPPILGFSFDVQPVKRELVAIENIIEEYSPAIFTGATDPDIAVPKMMKKLDSADMQKVMKEMKKQVDAWWAKNKKN